MGKVITVASTKGGVGKSTLARFLAVALDEKGFTTCIVDLCQNSSISTGFLEDRDAFEHSVLDWLTGEVPPSRVIQQYELSNIYYIPSKESVDDFEDWVKKKLSTVKRLHVIASKIEPLKKMFDFIIFDTHPSENSDLVSYALMASDYCIVPLEVDLDSKLAAVRVAEIVNEFKEIKEIDYGIVPNKVSVRNGKIRSQLERMKKELLEQGINDFLPPIRYTDVISTTKNDGIMLNKYDNVYARNVMNDFRVLTDEVLDRLGVTEEARVNE